MLPRSDRVATPAREHRACSQQCHLQLLFLSRRFNVFNLKAISANTTSELLSEPLVVQENEVIKVTAATADRLHVVASLLEMS